MVDSRIREHFDQIAGTYHEEISGHVREHLINKWWTLVSVYLPKNANILDVGCGEGTNVKFLRDKGINAFGIDASPRLIEMGKERYPEMGDVIEEGDAHALRFEPNSFDAVSMIGVLHHMSSKKDQRRAINEAIRVLKEDGHLVIRESNVKNPLFRIFWNYIFPLTAKIDKFGGENWVSTSFYEREGFCVEQIRYFTFLPNLTPKWFMQAGKKIEAILERSIFKSYSAHYIVILKKSRKLCGT
jgi:ubiquinone/menaquinone biosynthesis C-methylase UbiE